MYQSHNDKHTKCISEALEEAGFAKTCWRPWLSNRIQVDHGTEFPSGIIRIGSPEVKSRNSKEICHLEAQRSAKILSDCQRKSQIRVLDPRGRFAKTWNLLFFMASIISLFVDPVFFLIPEARPEFCIQFGGALKLGLTIIRSVTDLVYVIHIFVQFRTAYVTPSSCVLGRGDLVVDLWSIATRYLRCGFWIDLTAALPLPQVFIWAILPNLKGSASRFKAYLNFTLTIQTLQMLLRLIQAYPLSLQLCKASGVITENGWLGTAYTVIFYLFPCIVSGNMWYILSIQRQKQCWDTICNQESSSCVEKYFDCSNLGDPNRFAWIQSSNISYFCDPENNLYPYGIYSFTVSESVSSGRFANKFFYCLWWGITNISTQGQNLVSSMDITEDIFCLLSGVVGLCLFGFLLGKVQKYVRCTGVRVEEWTLKQTDLEQWMHNRQLPKELRQSILNYYNYKWIATQGVNEETILKHLPVDLRRKTKRYLCLNLVQEVPLFDQLDDRTLNAICDRLKPTFYTQGMYVVCEGKHVDEMLFIMRGHLYSYTTDGGRSGFFNSSRLGPKDFCGEELLTWALDTRLSYILPSSTRTVKALSDVEGFSLKAEDLKFITTQFRRMHSRELRDKLRFYSQQWRKWAACFIQAAWRRHTRRNRLLNEETRDDWEVDPREEQQDEGCLSENFPSSGYQDMNVFVPKPGAGIEVYAARLLADKRSSLSSRFG